MLWNFSCETQQLLKEILLTRSHQWHGSQTPHPYLGVSSLIHDLQQQSLVLLSHRVLSISQSVY